MSFSIPLSPKPLFPYRCIYLIDAFYLQRSPYGFLLFSRKFRIGTKRAFDPVDSNGTPSGVTTHPGGGEVKPDSKNPTAQL